MKTLDDLLAEGVAGKRVLVRSNLNVPLQDGHITDDSRIQASLPVIKALADAHAKVIVCAHLGRPKGKPEPSLTLRPVADRLAELSSRKVAFAADTVGPDAQAKVAQSSPGDTVLLENVRFEADEISKDEQVRSAYAQRLATLGDCYVLDAFGDAHRAQASVSDVARFLPHYAGWLVVRELDALQGLVGVPKRPFVVVLGGAKVSDKLGLIAALLSKVDTLLIGGGMCFTFLKAMGQEVGKSLVEDDMLDTCRRLLTDAGQRIVLPTDVVVAERISEDATANVVPIDAIPSDHMGLDIGSQTVGQFREVIGQAETLFWNGPMGVFEVSQFADGTKGVAEAIAENSGVTVVGGGDSASAVRALGIPQAAFSHISTGGGASLEFLEGKTLPGLAALED